MGGERERMIALAERREARIIDRPEGRDERGENEPTPDA